MLPTFVGVVEDKFSGSAVVAKVLAINALLPSKLHDFNDAIVGILYDLVKYFNMFL